MSFVKLFSRRSFYKFSFAGTILFLLFISFTYFRYATTFSFVDEYTNIIAAYFISHGRGLYGQIFFHHQMLMPYISYFLLKAAHPGSLYHVILFHRLFVVFFSLVMDILLILRFRYVGIGFAVFYEPLKYYLFGNLFLAESFIVYPSVYLLGLIWESLSQKKIKYWEILLATFATVFVIFMREPYIPLILLMYVFLLLKVKNTKKIFISVVLLIVLSSLLLATVSIKDFIFDLIQVNFTYVVPQEINNTGKYLSLLISFFYPFYILFEHGWNFYRVILIGIDVIFLFTLGFLFYKKYNPFALIFSLILLALANVRWVSSTINFYEAYHAVEWFGMFCFMLFIFLKELYRLDPKKTRLLIFATGIIFLGMIFYPRSYLWQKVNREDIFTINYGRFYTNGQIINLLSKPTDTVFIDNWDSLIFWQADRGSSYPYALYYPVQNYVPIFINARSQMFSEDPPDFYYTDCEDNSKIDLIPKNARHLYTRIYYGKRPACLYIKTTKIKDISQPQMKQLNDMKFYLSSGK